ncbi:MAG: class II fructose-bisphosphate aldolase family protein [Saprospiraceae bacterium]|nr:class II fructose-bisphosphate aldolase family protein [Saprospiraceae bacterium]
MKLTAKRLFEHCYGRYAVAAVNVEFMEQVLALFAAAEAAQAPFIVQTTPAARNYASPDMLVSMIKAAAKKYPKTVFALHLDHGNEEHIDHALAGEEYTSVMIDASHDDFAENVSRTRKVVQKAHSVEVSVEAELGVLAGVEDDLSVNEEHAFYTNPEEVEAFVSATECDSLAIAVGTSHGAYKFSGGQGIQFHILEEIQNRLPTFPLVLHGGSAVNYAEIERINAAGGELQASAKGVDPAEVKRAIEYGVCKVNIATDLRLLWTRVNREFFRDTPDQFAPLLPGRVYMEECKRLILEKFEYLGAVGQATRIKSK